MITGKMFRDGIISASNNIANSRQAVDALNIFPVPDGDTGTNMSMTIGAAAKEMAVLPDSCTIEEASSRCASALLRGARGNSGVILSLIFRGFSKAFKGLETADAKAIAKAFSEGVEAAYKAVMKPTEGTILTVIRKASEAASELAKTEESPMEVASAALKAAIEALAKTPDQLPVLKKQGLLMQAVRDLYLYCRALKVYLTTMQLYSRLKEVRLHLFQLLIRVRLQRLQTILNSDIAPNFLSKRQMMQRKRIR